MHRFVEAISILICYLMMKSYSEDIKSKSSIKVKPPLISIASLVSKNDTNYDELQFTVEQIGDAITNWGFFYISDHTLDPVLIKKFLIITQRFFLESSQNQLNSIRRAKNNSRGYTDKEFTKQKIDLKRIFDVGHKPFPNLSDTHPGKSNFAMI